VSEPQRSRRAAASLLTRDEARRMAVNIREATFGTPAITAERTSSSAIIKVTIPLPLPFALHPILSKESQNRPPNN